MRFCAESRRSQAFRRVRLRFHPPRTSPTSDVPPISFGPDMTLSSVNSIEQPDASENTAGFMLYEFPCNEKIRMYLRLEMLFRRFDWFCAQEDPVAHHAALSALFDLVDASARSDLRNELIQELVRQRQHLENLRGNEAVRQDALEPAIAELSECCRTISNTVGRSGQVIRENEWLQLVRTRQSIPGGTCEFDMPMLHYWLALRPEVRREELLGWAQSMFPTRDAIQLVLRLLRASSVEHYCTAVDGMFQKPMTGRNYALARIWIPEGDTLIPEVSANKYMLWVRFSRPDHRRRLHVVHERVEFRLGLCG